MVLETGFCVWVGDDLALYWIEVGPVLTIPVLERKEDLMIETVLTWMGRKGNKREGGDDVG